MYIEGHFKHASLLGTKPIILIKATSNGKLVCITQLNYRKLNTHTSCKTGRTQIFINLQKWSSFYTNYDLYKFYKLEVILSLRQNIGDRNFLNIWNKVEQWLSCWYAENTFKHLQNLIAITLFKKLQSGSCFWSFGSFFPMQ